VVAQSIILESFKGFGGFLHPGRIIGTSGFQEGSVLIRVSTVWRRKTQHLGFILQGGISLALIYLLVEFGITWRSSSAGPKPWPSHPSSRTCQQLGGLDVTLALLYLVLHLIFSLWRLIGYCREHFVAAHIFYLGAI
jgi:hypothetical protein